MNISVSFGGIFGGGAFRAIAEGRGDDQFAPAAYLHADDALFPTRITWPLPSVNGNGSFRFHDASNTLPVL